MTPLLYPASDATRVSAIWSKPSRRTAFAALIATLMSVWRERSVWRVVLTSRLSHTVRGIPHP